MNFSDLREDLPTAAEAGARQAQAAYSQSRAVERAGGSDTLEADERAPVGVFRGSSQSAAGSSASSFDASVAITRGSDGEHWKSPARAVTAGVSNFEASETTERSAENEPAFARSLASAELQKSPGCQSNAGLSLADSDPEGSGGETNGETDGNTRCGWEGDRSGNTPHTFYQESDPHAAGECASTDEQLLDVAEQRKDSKGLEWAGHKPLMRSRTPCDGAPQGSTFSNDLEVSGGSSGTQRDEQPHVDLARPLASLSGDGTNGTDGTDVSARRLTEAALMKGAERARLLKVARPLFGSHTLEEIAGLVGTSAPTLCRLKRDYAHLSDDELIPENLAAEFTNSGRTSPYQALADDPKVQQRLEELYLLSCGASSDYMTKGRRTGSAAAVLKIFARDPLCPPMLSEELRRGKEPAPLVRVIRRVTDLMEQRSRGEKHAGLHGTVTHRRSLIEIMADGSQVPIELGDWWVFDDMSDNMPHWWALENGTEETKGTYGIGRQGLYAYDPARPSGTENGPRGWWLGVEKIGTVRDSYTAAIILRFIRRLMQDFGKPRRGIVFERSVWQAQSIAGFRITANGSLVDEEVERDPLANEERALIQKGLESLGLKIHYTHTPRGKEIESAFNYLQRLKPMVATLSGPAEAGTPYPIPVNIGRHAGEYEHAAKQLRRARAMSGGANSFNPAELGFLHIDASADLDEKVMQIINEERQVNGAGYPDLPPLEQRDMAVFLPEIRELELRNGKVTAKEAGQPFDFCAPELFASLGSGYRLYVRFDPSEPTLGAAIYNRETSSANFEGWQDGMFIGFAEFLPEVARFDWRSEKDSTAEDIKRRFNKHVRTAYRAVGMKHARAATVRDGRGNVAEVGGQRPEVRGQRPESQDRLKPGLHALPAPTEEQRRARSERLRRQSQFAKSLQTATSRLQGLEQPQAT
jgi:hypothetical protein